MTEDPKNLPAWLRKESEDQEKAPPPPPAAPPPSDPPASDDEDAVPPWLREDQPLDAPPPPSTSGLKRLAPRPEGDDQGDVPPWLKGLDEPKSYSIGGTELSEEYLAGGDELADSDQTDLTFDLWLAQQTESTREKDIEEEVPDLLSAIEEDKDTPAPPATGQLPDWFLGLEELDTSDAPEWFSAEEKPPASNEPPPWISDMVEESDESAEPPAKASTGSLADDDIVSFFDSLTGTPSDTPPSASADDDDEGEPDLEWLIEQQPLDVDDLPTDDFFTGAADAPEDDATPDWFYQSGAAAPADDDPFADEPDEFDEADAEPDAAPAVEIPQNELDAFFDNLAADRAATHEDTSDATEDIEEPDLAWFVDEEEAPAEPDPLDDIPEPDIEVFSEEDENTLSWLNELGSIVSSASRSSEPYRPETPASFTDDIPDEAWSQPEASAPDSGLNWSNLPDSAADRAAADVPPEDDWLSSIAPDPEQESHPSAADTLPLSPSGLLGRHADQPPEATPDEIPPDAAAQIDWEDTAPEAVSAEEIAAAEEPAAYEEATVDEQDDRYPQDNSDETGLRP